MRHKHPYENRYCNTCQCTTRHEVKDIAYACLRCGVIKYPTARAIKPGVMPVSVLPISA
jgi:hypothetical protein